MPELSKALVPPHMGEANASKKIMKLGKKITDVAAHKLHGVTADDPEYWGLAEIVTEEMADIALTMKVRHHYTFDMLYSKFSKKYSREELQKLLDEMSNIGLLEYDYGNHYDHDGRTAPPSERRYCLPMFVPGSAELFNMDDNPETGHNKRLEEHPALASFFERMTFIPLAGITNLVPAGGAGIGMHVIPVEKAIEMESTSVDLEHLSYWLKKYEGHIGVGICSCRASRAVIDDGCADDEHYWCIGVGDFADYSRETGKGHDITVEEALRILQVAEDNGFVHQTTNIDGENKIFGICNCNVNICNALRTSQLFNTPNLSRSAYCAHVDTSKCVACGKCVEFCPAGAVRLGQQLCTKDGGQISYPKNPLPIIGVGKWGPEHWDEDYRDNNRKNCHDTGTAPCKTACPAHVSVQGYIRKAKEGKYLEALELIKKDNPFPAICGRVCNKRCEAACTRGTIDAPVAIDDIKKFVAAQDLNAETRFVPPVVIASSVKTQWDEKIAVIGAGPAGLSCAYYLATKGYKPVVFEKSARPGGMMTYGIPAFKLEKDVIEAEIDVLRALGVEIRCGVEVGKDVTLDALRAEGFKAFYVAIGCQGARKAGIPGEDAKGIDYAVSFLHSAIDNNGQSMPGKVVVVGGGNVAIDCARTAHRFGASEVSMFALESRETMPAAVNEVEEAEEESVVINNGWGPKEVLKNEDGTVRGVVFKKCLSTIDPETKRFNPQYDENQTMEVAADAVVFAIGQAIEWGGLLDGVELEQWHGNYPVADKLTYQTSVADIFVGGDVYSGPKFVIDAIEAGKCAAESLHRFVQNGHMTIGRNRRDFIELDKENIKVEGYDVSERQVAAALDTNGEDPKMSFKDFAGTLTAEQVHTEASRCLGCGASIVDENKCLGCGVCTTKCMFDAITLHRDHPDATHFVPSEDKFKLIVPYMLKNNGKRMEL